MGEVYLAEDETLSRQLAIKVPRRNILDQPELLDRFRREARFSAGLRHHNICPIYEVDEVGGVPYIAMAYIEGRPLADVVRSGERPTPAWIAHVIRRVALGLDFAHRAGIVHRDLKPANVIIDRDGEPIVMDFGLAGRPAADGQSRLTQDGMIVGTPSYMSPEQVRGEADRIGPASDVYSLGVILYELLTGRLPFSGPMMSLLMDVAADQKTPPRPSEVQPGIDPRLEAICLRMLTKPAAGRVASMQEDAAALSGRFDERDEKLIETAPMMSGTGGSTPPRSRRRRLLAAAGGLTLLCGVIVITIRNKDGSVQRIEVPESSQVSVTHEARDVHQPTNRGSLPADAPAPAVAPFDEKQARRHQEAWAASLKVPAEYTNSIGMKFRLIPPGEFLMGSPAAEIEEALKVLDPVASWDESIKSEAPRHRVILTEPIYLGVHEVTQANYIQTTDVTPDSFNKSKEGKEAAEQPDTSAYPADSLTWGDAAEFCIKLSELEKLKPQYFRSGEKVTFLKGGGYRLPTEAEWEFGCRAGTTTQFWCGDKAAELIRVAWLGENSGQRMHAVGELKPNPFGLCDMHGNVYEWVQDHWEAGWYDQFKDQPAVDPTGAAVNGSPIFRGGYWGDAPTRCRAGLRKVGVEGYRGHHIGFRIVLPVAAVQSLEKR